MPLPAILLAACQAAAPASPPPAHDPAPASPQATGGPTLSPARTPSPAPTLSPAATSRTPEPDTSPTFPAATDTTAEPSGGRWHYLAGFPAEGAIEVTSVTGWGSGYVAVGFQPAEGEGFAGRRQGVIWTSVDGREWTRHVPPELQHSSLQYVVSLGGQLFTFGRYSQCPDDPAQSEGCVDAPDAGTAGWRSADALSWHRLTLPPSMSDQETFLDGAAVGMNRMAVFGITGDEVAAVWFSGDGEVWDERRDLAGLDPIDTLAGSPDRFVAFGTRYVEAEDRIETLAAYSEGAGFQSGVLPPATSVFIDTVAWGAAGFVAIGSAEDLDAEDATGAALVSPDGLSWAAAEPANMPADVTFGHALAVPTGYVAIGLGPEDETLRAEVSSWFSTDGLDWQSLGPLATGVVRQLNGSAVGESGIVVFGVDFDDEAELSAGTVHAWFAPLAALRPGEG